MKNKEIIIPAAALTLICLVATLLLSLTNHVTKGQIANVQKAQADQARMLVCPDAASFEEAPEYADAEVYKALDADGNLIGYAVTTSGKSYGGTIDVMTGFGAGMKVTGVQILNIEDTPGLGMNAKKEAFRDQFIGKSAGELMASKTASQDSEVQAITGATITSNAVTKCVNDAWNAVFAVEGGQK